MLACGLWEKKFALISMERNRTGCRFLISARTRFRMTRYFHAIGLSCKKLMPKNSLSFGSFELELGNEKGHFKEKTSAECFLRFYLQNSGTV